MALTPSEPLLAAVVICRNEERWIAQSLRAVLDAVQPYAGSEVVLVDSCSSDRTVERAAALPVRIVELRPDAPLSPALGRLVGQALTRSRYVLFGLDAPDDPGLSRAAARSVQPSPARDRGTPARRGRTRAHGEAGMTVSHPGCGRRLPASAPVRSVRPVANGSSDSWSSQVGFGGITSSSTRASSGALSPPLERNDRE